MKHESPVAKSWPTHRGSSRPICLLKIWPPLYYNHSKGGVNKQFKVYTSPSFPSPRFSLSRDQGINRKNNGKLFATIRYAHWCSFHSFFPFLIPRSTNKKLDLYVIIWFYAFQESKHSFINAGLFQTLNAGLI